MSTDTNNNINKNTSKGSSDKISRSSKDSKKLKLSKIKKVPSKYEKSLQNYLITSKVTEEAIAVHENGIIKFANKKFAELFGLKTKEVKGINIQDLTKTPINPEFFSNKKIYKNNQYIIDYSKKDKPLKRCSLKNFAIKVLGKNYNVLVLKDITEQEFTENKIKYLSFHDKLTNLYNRAFFEEELKRLNTERQLPLSIIIADVNSLKLINDAFGHTRGDELLKTCAKIFKNCLRKEDIIARWGGDEFAVILPKTSNETAKELTKRIVKECEGIKNFNLPISIAVGASTKTSINQSIEEKVKVAEDSMYKQKLFGKKEFRSLILSSLEKTLIRKSNETEDHFNRMSKLAIEIGSILKLSDNEISGLIILSKLHDIGKVVIPDSVLSKNGSLTEKEWKIIKKHPQIGSSIVETAPQLAHIAEYILYHHEHWDGSGYPQGLKGDEIPLLSRIISIIDAFDVMTNDTNYHKPLSTKEAIEEIKRHTGKQFDPKLAQIFINMIEEKNYNEVGRA